MSIQRLEEALRNADAAGDAEAATKLAAELRTQLAAAGQAPTAPEPSRGEKVKDFLTQDVAGGVVLGGQGLRELGDLVSSAPLRAGLHILGLPQEIADAKPETQRVKEDRKSLNETFPRKPGKTYYTRSAVEGAVQAVPAVLSGGLTALPAAVGAGTTAGLGGEAGEQVTGQPWGRVVGSLLGGGLAAGATGAKDWVMRRTRPNAQKEFVDALTKYTDASGKKHLIPELEQVPARMREAKAQGLTVVAPQVMTKEGPMNQALDDLVRHPSGQNVQRILRDQPEEVSLLNSSMAGSIPGQVTNKADVGQRGQQAASGFIDQMKKLRSNAWKRIAKDAPELGQGQVKQLDDRLAAYAAMHPNTDKGALAEAIRKSMRNPSVNEEEVLQEASQLVGVNGKPLVERIAGQSENTFLTSPSMFKDAVDDAFGNYKQLKLNAGGSTSKTVAGEHELRKMISDFYDSASPQLADANKTYATLSKVLVNPNRAGVTGRVAGRSGFDDGVPAPDKIFTLFEGGTTNPQRSEIRELARDLKTVDPHVFPDAVSTWFQHKLANVADTSAKPTPEYSQKVYSSLFGTEAKRQGFRDMVMGVARSYDAKPDEVKAAVRGVDMYIKMLETASRRPMGTPGATTAALRAAAGGDAAADVIQLGSQWMPARIARLVREGKANQALAFIDEAFASPEGMERLIALAKANPTNKAFAQALATMAVAQDGVNSAEIPSNISAKNQEQ